MKNPLLIITLILVFSLSSSLVSSCKKISENVYAANALVGVWRLGGTTVEITVEGVDIIEYLMTTYGYTEDEAQEIKDDIIDDVFDNYINSITFYGDKTFQATMIDRAEESGTWSVNADGKTLDLYFEEEEVSLTILEQTSSSLKLQFPAKFEDVDIDDDGVNETTLEINIEQDLTKTSRGGMGQ